MLSIFEYVFYDNEKYIYICGFSHKIINYFQETTDARKFTGKSMYLIILSLEVSEFT
jgi:hypothetical protein